LRRHFTLIFFHWITKNYCSTNNKQKLWNSFIKKSYRLSWEEPSKMFCHNYQQKSSKIIGVLWCLLCKRNSMNCLTKTLFLRIFQRKLRQLRENRRLGCVSLF
jgi:hypothetical protein